jgi:diguanylate cyclase (GGDEF)-like protein
VARVVDTVARLGGDEFALLLEDMTSADGAMVVAERAVNALSERFDLAGQWVHVGASIGVAVRSDASTVADDLIQEADAAMYESKRTSHARPRRDRERMPRM